MYPEAEPAAVWDQLADAVVGRQVGANGAASQPQCWRQTTSARRGGFQRSISLWTDEPTVEQQQVSFLQTLGAEAPSMPPDHLLNAEPFKKMELALVSLENFFQRVSHGSAEEMYGAAAAAELSPDLTLGEMNSAPMDTSINQQSSAGLSPFSSTTEQAHFPSSLADSVSYAPSPIPWSCIEGKGVAMRRRRCILQDRARTGPSPPHRLPRLPLFVSWKSSIASLSSVVPSDFQVG